TDIKSSPWPSVGNDAQVLRDQAQGPSISSTRVQTGAVPTDVTSGLRVQVARVEGVGAPGGNSQAPPIPCALERLKSFIRSTRLSLSRRSGGVLSTGFTRVTSICGKVAVGALVIVAEFCACAASDQVATALPNRLINLRHFIPPPVSTSFVAYLRTRNESQTRRMPQKHRVA